MRDRVEKFRKFEGLNLYIKNLDNSIDNVHLRNYFEIPQSLSEVSICLMVGIFIS
jgi:hypothetical protein